MCKSFIQGEAGNNSLVSIEASGRSAKIEAFDIKADRMPLSEKQPNYSWLVLIGADNNVIKFGAVVLNQETLLH